MCGIAGFAGHYEPALLPRLLDSIVHRGPDDEGVFIDRDARIGLGHRRLSIIDLSPLGHQPMVSEETKVVIVFNGEIYNFRELRQDLERNGVQFRGHSDTEVLLNLYLAKGINCLDHLNGIFAFAIWDPRIGQLFLARDQLGIKPFYYAEQATGFVFSSEMKSLIRSGVVPPSLNPSSVLAHLGFLWSPGEHPVVQGIKKLEPGHALLVVDGKVRRHWRYYDLPYDQPLLDISENEAAQAVAAAVDRAVDRQMVADVPVGAFLSGGLDSSAVVACAKRHAPDAGINCFTIDVQASESASEGFASDLPYAKRVANHLGVDLHVVEVGDELADRLPEMLYYLDEPTADPAGLNALLIAELARSHGIKVLLSGAGGDDIFTGYRRHFALQQEHYWAWLPSGLRRTVAALAGHLPSDIPLSRRLSKAFQYASLEADQRLVSYFFWCRPSIALGLLNKDFSQGLGENALFDPMLKTLAAIPSPTAPINRMLYLECKHFLADHNLNYTDKTGMARGVEVRVPLLDLDLVKLAAQLPVNFKQRGRTGKWIFKKAMESYLPRDVIYRPKTGFGVPLRYWLRTRLKPLVDDALSRESIHNRGIFDFAAVTRLRAQDESGKVDGTYTLFAIICLELWCRQYLDGNYFKTTN